MSRTKPARAHSWVCEHTDCTDDLFVKHHCFTDELFQKVLFCEGDLPIAPTMLLKEINYQGN